MPLVPMKIPPVRSKIFMRIFELSAGNVVTISEVILKCYWNITDQQKDRTQCFAIDIQSLRKDPLPHHRLPVAKTELSSLSAMQLTPPSWSSSVWIRCPLYFFLFTWPGPLEPCAPIPVAAASNGRTQLLGI